MVDLESIYRRTLEACAPEVAVSGFVDASMPRNVVAIGKCAGRMVEGVAFERAFCAIPRGYPRPSSSRIKMTFGGHPEIDDDSFRAGEALLEFVDQSDDVLFLISGGGSACVEVPLPPFTREEIATTSARLVASDLPIGSINTVRKHLSAIKGGRLAARVRGRSITLVYSDVSAGASGDVASGPTVADPTTKADAVLILLRLGGCDHIVTKLREETTPETVKQIGNTSTRIIADNATLTAVAARLLGEAGQIPVVWPDQVEGGVEDAAVFLAERARMLRKNEVLVAGGEPTVVRRGSARGGRCCELAVRFAMHSPNEALFGTSDGVDGSSGVAAIHVGPALHAELALQPAHGRPRIDPRILTELLERSDSLSAANLVGRAVIIPPTGNNLRDLFLVAGVNGVVAHH